MQIVRIAFGLLILVAARLPLALLVVLLRGGRVNAWALALAVAACIGLAFFGTMTDALRASYYAQEYSPNANLIRQQIPPYARGRIAFWLLYLVALVLLALV